ncbi:hypothetical protein VW29_19695 [Devosia limi DSM 17137]|uniref:AraC-type DNA-binding protein n=1 Tax=Devosia limi DSM 17137 TaxID=1121477 RepID=A0A0F5L5E2_9HYPH|nr:helix-turn-helix domain-containing protein [Devosia limi]KKB76857.1 hypothetical protein VW29_19695 [Devosia limi DSM 17137]SHF27036.1 AraC-type DNA-binding protein [Devosia limi DSM 17137]
MKLQPPNVKASNIAPRPAPRADRSFYASGKAFGRFGIRSFQPQVMAEAHSHGHIELNWLTTGSIGYSFDGRPAEVPAGRLVAFWAGIPHQALTLSPDAGRQVNIYLPMDAFLHMPRLGQLTETLMGGGVIQLHAEVASLDMVERWHQDYRSGDAQRSDLAMIELGTMFRRTALLGWDALLPAWIEPSAIQNRSMPPVHYVVQMVRHIVENLTEPLATQTVAAVVGLHPNYASNLFTAVMHIPIQKFVVRMRLIKARGLLLEGRLSTANVGFQSGFASQSQFYEHFRKAYGTTPSQMRNSSRR